MLFFAPAFFFAGRFSATNVLMRALIFSYLRLSNRFPLTCVGFAAKKKPPYFCLTLFALAGLSRRLDSLRGNEYKSLEPIGRTPRLFSRFRAVIIRPHYRPPLSA
jgi:hypothetical protein